MHIITKTCLRCCAIVVLELSALAGIILVAGSYGTKAGCIFAACAFAVVCGLAMLDIHRLWHRWLTWRFLRSLKKQYGDQVATEDLRKILTGDTMKSESSTSTYYENFKKQ